jgi:hypothetical protein
MIVLQLRLCELLRKTADWIRESRLPGDMGSQIERLIGQVDQPCEVAVVGRVKAGKSTFINALLGAQDELAKVGATETTATINYFRYGQPDPSKPVRCYWQNGTSEDVTREFLNSLQGNDLETLQRADGIHHLEYRLPNRYLEHVVLVDTPGLGAVVDEHQNRTADYMHLYRQLRKRHDLETQELDSKADAVIYLTNAVALVTDRDFLHEFGQVTGGRSKALNAIGVMARIDEQPDILARRGSLAAKTARQLEQHLNTVVPVSGGLEFALHRLGRDGLKRLAQAFSPIPSETLDAMLESDEMYVTKTCPLSVKQREELLDDKIPWTVFTTIVRRVAAAGADLDRVAEELTDLAGFRPLKETLERHFFQRAAYLRYFRIVKEARDILSSIRFRELPKLKARDREEQAQKERFLAFIHEARGNSATAAELEEFIARVCGVARRAEQLDRDLPQWSKGFDRLFHDLEEYNADFEALQLVEQHHDLFTAEERDELRPLLGLYGFENEKRLRSDKLSLDEVGRRQQRWHLLAFEQRKAIRTRVAERAVARYGLILEEMNNQA